MASARAHWDAVYERGPDDGLSWHEDTPAESLQLILGSCASPP